MREDRHAAKWRALVEAMSLPVPPELEAFAEKVERHAYRVMDADVAALSKRGCSEDAIFEAVLTAAARAADDRLRKGLEACG